MTPNTKITIGRDWFLIGIVAGITTLIVTGLMFALLEPNSPEYLPEDEPQGVAYNYVLALQRREYDRAYGYLSTELPQYPADANQFFSEVGESWNCVDEQLSESTLQIDESELFGNRATVRLEQTVFNSGDIFSSGTYTRMYTMDLIQEGEAWKIQRSDICWLYTWNEVPRS